MNTSNTNLASISLNFPRLTKYQLDRSQYHDIIDKYFNEENKVLFISGASGVGKTHLLADFCLKNPDNAISIFTNKRDKKTYDAKSINYDLGSQIHWLLTKEDIDPDMYSDDYLRQSHINLKKFTKKMNQNIYFIFDGLDNIPDTYFPDINEIISNLPFASQNIYFLFSGEEKKLKDKLSILFSLNSKEIHLPSFGLDETKAYINLFRNDLIKYANDIYKITGGVAFKLDSIRSLVQSGKRIEDIINNKDSTNDFLQMQWEQVDRENNDLLYLIAFMSFSENKYPLLLLSEITGIEFQIIQNLLINISFIVISEKHPHFVEFIHDNYKEFLKNKLSNFEQKVRDDLYNFYINHPDNYEKITNLSTIYENQSQWKEIIDLLTPDNYNIMLDHNRSLKTIIMQTEKGINAANKLKDTEYYFRFNLYKSTLLEFEYLDIWKSEIEAKTQIGDFDGALTLAQSAFLIEDRLKLLSLVTKKMKKKSISIDINIAENIEELCKIVTFNKLDDNVIEIAANLMYTSPNLAIELVEKSSQYDGGNLIDWAFAQLSMSILKDKLKDNNEDKHENFDEYINSRIKNSKIKNIIQGLNYFGNTKSSQDIKLLISTVEKPNEKLFFIRNWIKINRDDDDIDTILEEAFNIIIRSSEYIASASIMKDLAYGLKGIKDFDKLQKLITYFDSLKDTIKRRGPSKDYLIYNLNIAESIMDYDYNMAIDRILELYYYYVPELEELIIKTDCLAILLNKLIKLNENFPKIREENLLTDLDKEIKNNIEKIIIHTAFHYDSLCEVIHILTSINRDYAEYASTICERMNIKYRRNQGFHSIINTIIEKNKFLYGQKFILKMYDSITYSEIRNIVLIEYFDKIVNNPEMEIIPELLEKFYKDIEYINDSILQSFCYVRSYIVYKKNILIDSSLLSNSANLLKKAWNKIDSAWDKIEVAFNICASLAEWDINLAKEFLYSGINERNNTFLDSPQRAKVLISTIVLSIRAFSALDLHEDNTEYLKLKKIINELPSLSSKLILWGDLAARLRLMGNFKLSDTIIRNEIKSKLPLYSEIDPNTINNTMLRIAPILFIYHKESTLLDIEKYVEDEFRENIYLHIINFIFTKCLDESECEQTYFEHNLTFENLLDCVLLIEKLSTDISIFNKIKKIVDVLTNKDAQFTFEQKALIKNKLSLIINSKLPDIDNIQHNGYKISSLAQLLRIDKDKFDKWQELISMTKSVNNTSDRALILTYILEALNTTRKTAFDFKKNEIAEDIKNTIRIIPSFNEFASRTIDYLPVLKIVNRNKCISELNSFFSNLIEEKDNNNLTHHKNIIDIANTIDNTIAESLIAKYDEDPSRKRIGENVKNFHNSLKLKNDIFHKNELSKYEKINYPEVSNSLLESLNAKRVPSKPLKELNNFIENISETSLSHSFPISLYIVENAIHRHRNTPAANSIIRNIFDATIFCSEMVYFLGRKSMGKPVFTETLNDQTSILIQKGEFSEALCFIKSWARNYSISDFVIIDPYFSFEELKIINEFLEIDSKINFVIITGYKHNKIFIDNKNHEDIYKDYWNKISIDNHVNIKVVFVGNNKDFSPPFHDRWCLINRGSAGLRLGSSFNSIGLKRDTEISELSKIEAKNIFDTIAEQYSEKSIREYKGEKLVYRIFFI